MKRLIFITLISLVFILISCNLFEPESDIPGWYPSTLSYDPDQFSDYMTELSVFCDSFDLEIDDVEPDSICNHISGIFFPDIPGTSLFLCTYTEDSDTQAVFESSALDFVNTWEGIFSAEDFVMSSYENRDNFQISLYPINTYENPIYGGSGALGNISLLALSETGEMLWMRSSLISQLPIPTEPLLDSLEISEIIDGYAYATSSMVGYENKVFSIDDCSSCELMDYIFLARDEDPTSYTGERIEYRLVWVMSNFDGDFIIDAMTGDILAFRQSWVS